MPGMELLAVSHGDPALRTREHRAAYEAAAGLTPYLGDICAASLREVSGQTAIDGAAWPIVGRTMDPGLSTAVAPIYLIVRMNPRYNGFDFRGNRAALHAALRRRVAGRLRAVNGGTLPCDFMVRVEFMIAAGSYVHMADGAVSEEYGGETDMEKV